MSMTLHPGVRAIATIGLTLCCYACQPQQSAVATNKDRPAESVTNNQSQVFNAKQIDVPEVHLRPESKPYISIQTVAPESGGVSVRAPGRLDFRPKAISGVGAVIAGRVAKLHVQTGDKVVVGQSLITLSSPEAAGARAKRRKAEVEVHSAMELLKRQAEMVRRGVGLELDRFKAEVRLKEARSELERAEEAVKFLGDELAESVILRASIDGTVVRVKARTGEMIEPGETLVVLGNADALWVVDDVFDRDLALVSTGATASVELATQSTPMPGRVVAVGAVLEAASRRAPVYIELENQDSVLRPGMYARIAIKATTKERISLPVSAVLIKDGKRTIVYVEKSEGVFQAREVAVGQSVNLLVPILQGLQAGDRVVVNGALLLDTEAEQLL